MLFHFAYDYCHKDIKIENAVFHFSNECFCFKVMIVMTGENCH